MHHAELRRCLETCDVAAIRRLWAHVSPHLPQPASDAEALVALHHARTQTRSLAFKLRAYSHRWLVDQGFPSALPDELKPRAERMYPKIAEGVGLAVHSSPLMRPVALMLRGAMENAVYDAYASSKAPAPEFVKVRIAEARDSMKRVIAEAVGDLRSATTATSLTARRI